MKSTPSITRLQVDWHRSSDLERARAVHTIKQSGVSIRKIAAELQVSESLLRHLLHALQAPSSDRVLAKQGEITTNELVRRAKAAGLRRDAHQREAIELERAKAARKAADVICDWLAREHLPGSYGEQIIEAVRREFAKRQLAGGLPQRPKGIEITTKELIERCRPKRPIDDNAAFIGWYHEWLCRWSFFAFSDDDIRDTALDLALQKQWDRK